MKEKKKRKKKKTILNLPDTNTNFFFELSKGKKVRKAVALYDDKKQKLDHLISTKIDTLKCNSFPGSIHCERTSIISCLFCKVSWAWKT